MIIDVACLVGFVLFGALPIIPGILVYAVLWLLVPLEDRARNGRIAADRS